MKKYDYLNDSAFLKEIDHLKIREYYFKAISLDFTSEREIDSVEGLIKNGTINVDGSSAIRRTASLSVFCNTEEKDMRYFKQFFGITKKINLEIGIANLTKRYQEHEILWFPMGLYIITGASISHDISNGINVNLQLKDKMVLLNGDFGGTIPAATDLDRISSIDEETGEIKDIKCTIYQLIQELVNHFGGEQLEKIIISDIDTVAKQIVQWNSEAQGYVVLNNTHNNESNNEIKNYVVTAVAPSNPEDIYAILKQGDYIGYAYTDFTYPSSDWFSCNAGDSVVTMLDKIKSTLGNYEYFYDLEGNFIFREIKNYNNTSKATMDLKNSKSGDYLINISGGNAAYNFDDSSIITSYTNSPQYNKIKNDFVIWGTRTSGVGDKKTQHIIRYHLAIDTKPFVKYESVPEEHRRYVANYDEEHPNITSAQVSLVNSYISEKKQLKVTRVDESLVSMMRKTTDEEYKKFLQTCRDEVEQDINSSKTKWYNKIDFYSKEISSINEEIKKLKEELNELTKGTTSYIKKENEIKVKQEKLKDNKTLKDRYNTVYQLVADWDEDAIKKNKTYEYYLSNFVSESITIEDFNDIKENYLYSLFEGEDGSLYLPQYYDDSFPVIGDPEQYYINKNTNFIYSYGTETKYYLSLNKDSHINTDSYEEFINMYDDAYRLYSSIILNHQLEIDKILSNINDINETFEESFKDYKTKKPNSLGISDSLGHEFLVTNDEILFYEQAIYYNVLEDKKIKSNISYKLPTDKQTSNLSNGFKAYEKLIDSYITAEIKNKDIKSLTGKINISKTNKKDISIKIWYSNYKNIIEQINEKIDDFKTMPKYLKEIIDSANIFYTKISAFYDSVITVEEWNKSCSPSERKDIPLFYYTRSETQNILKEILDDMDFILTTCWTKVSNAQSEYYDIIHNYVLNASIDFNKEDEKAIRKIAFASLNEQIKTFTPFKSIEIYKNKNDFPEIDKEKDKSSYRSKIGYLDASNGNIYSKVVNQDYYWNTSSIQQRDIFPSDWRTQMYLQSKGQYAQESNVYCDELNGEWAKLYDLVPVTVGNETLYTGVLKPIVLEKGYNLDYFVDIVDSGSDFFNEMNVSNIGRRSYVKTVQGVNCIFAPEPIKDWIILDSTKDNSKIIEQCENIGESYVQIDSEIFQDCSIQGNKYYSAYDEVKSLLYTYTSYNNSVTLVSVPILYLEPNIRISIKDIYSDISGDFMLNNFSIQLGNSNTMNLSCTQVIETI